MDFSNQFSVFVGRDQDLRALKVILGKKVDHTKLERDEKIKIYQEWNNNLNLYIKRCNKYVLDFLKEYPEAQEFLARKDPYAIAKICSKVLSPFTSPVQLGLKLIIKNDFQAWANFEGIVFPEPVEFIECKFPGSLSFDESAFLHGVSFKRCSFCGFVASFYNTKINYWLSLSRCQFKGTPIFSFHEDTVKNLKEVVFSNVSFECPKNIEAESRFRQMKLTFQRMGQDRIARVAYAYEQESYRLNVGMWAQDYWILSGYKIINFYGIRPLQPLFLILIGTILFLDFLAFSWEPHLIIPPALDLNSGIGHLSWRYDLYSPMIALFVYAVEVFLGPLKLFASSGLMAGNIYLKVLSVFLSTLSALLWFMLVLGIRNYLKLEKIS